MYEGSNKTALLSQKLITEAMLRLLENKTFSEINVSDICREADVIVDTETGVNYLFVVYGNGAGLTPLIDENGRPIVTRVIVDD